MKLPAHLKAVKSPEEDFIFITSDDFLYYIYDPKNHTWKKHRDAGLDRVTTCRYPKVSEAELTEAMGGSFPANENDFLRLIRPSQLSIADMLALLEEDFPAYLSDFGLRHKVCRFLEASELYFRSYEKLRELLERAAAEKQSITGALEEIRKLSADMLGRDIFKKEIGIVDGPEDASFFQIRPVRVIDFEDTDDWASVAEMPHCVLSVEQDDAAQYLEPFLCRYFDDSLEANRRRVLDRWPAPDGGEDTVDYVTGFERSLTRNFYTPESVRKLLADIRDTADALRTGRETEYTRELKIAAAPAAAVLPEENDTALVIDFYRRFLYRMEYMLTVGRENGYDLISFMGP